MNHASRLAGTGVNAPAGDFMVTRLNQGGYEKSFPTDRVALLFPGN